MNTLRVLRVGGLLGVDGVGVGVDGVGVGVGGGWIGTKSHLVGTTTLHGVPGTIG